MFSSLRRRSSAPIDHGHRFALVDVETTGLSRHLDRVVQVAVMQVDATGQIEHRWSTLVDPGRDPGATHIHGISAQMLVGAPAFHGVVDQVSTLLEDRVVVAHNAIFDWEFLQHESSRTIRPLTSSHRLCTIALARRLDLDLPNMKLPTLAAWAGVHQQRWHDARDDVDTLHQVFVKLLDAAHHERLPLPLARNHALFDAVIPAVKAPRVDSPWRSPGRWVPNQPLAQGLKYAITGGTRSTREDLYNRSIAAGLVPMNSVSSRTGLVVCNDAGSATMKLRVAADNGISVMGEPQFEELLRAVVPGVSVTAIVIRPPKVPRPAGPLRGCRVLVLGGTHASAADVRERVAQAGGQAAVNLTPTVTHIVELDGAASDPRFGAAADRELLDPSTLTALARPESVRGADRSAAIVADLSGETVGPEVAVLKRGGPFDLPAQVTTWEMFVSWTLAESPLEIDVVAFVVDEHERVLSDDHFVFFNSLQTLGGSVLLDVDTDGEAEVTINLDEVSNPGVRVIVGAVVSGDATFGDVGPLEFVLRDPSGAPIVRSVLDAATVEKSMLVAEFYQRGDAWRIRAVGQGYEDDLQQFVERHGVSVDG